MNKKILIVSFIILVTCSLYLGNSLISSYAQQQEETVTANDNNNDNGVLNATNITTGAGLVGAGAAIVKTLFDNRKQNKNVKGTDVDVAKSIILLSKMFQVVYEIDPMWKRVLDTRVTSNVLNKQTLGEAFTMEADGWASFIQEHYNVARPSMSVPTNVEKNTDTTQEPTKETPPA